MVPKRGKCKTPFGCACTTAQPSLASGAGTLGEAPDIPGPFLKSSHGRPMGEFMGRRLPHMAA